MVGNGSNTSQLTSYELCRDCGNCCKTFRFWLPSDDDIGDRFRLTDAVITVSTDKNFPAYVMLEVNRPCFHLNKIDKNYTCAVFGDKQRPNLCNKFPDNLFNVDANGDLIWDDHANRISLVYKDYCPAVAIWATARNGSDDSCQ